MKQFCFCIVLIISVCFFSGCVAKKIDPSSFKNPDKKALYELMVKRCQAINNRDMSLFKSIYVKNSPELKWIEETGIPMWNKHRTEFKVSQVKKISIIGNDAAANFILSGQARTISSFLIDTVVLYVKVGDLWKIESAGDR
ncbi:MAG: hypothetical protein GY699_25105 [Desulfobacteraceae bacterium]|nr:hypothetical protein [Desulfobacteraceae bacterium]